MAASSPVMYVIQAVGLDQGYGLAYFFAGCFAFCIFLNIYTYTGPINENAQYYVKNQKPQKKKD